jgi:hypothetical protein
LKTGFAPYRVIRIDLHKDLLGWRPEKNKVDKYGKIQWKLDFHLLPLFFK